MRPTRILIVEDEAIVARDIEQQLVELGYEVVGITDMAEQAVPLASQFAPDLILMDIHLAGKMDGIEAATEVRKRLNIPVVFLTAFAGKDTLERAKLSDPFGYVIKPFNDRYLATVIEMALYKHRAESHLRRAYDEQATILRTALDAFFMADWQGRLLDVNEACCQMLGYAREELLKMSLKDFGVAQGRAQTAGLEDLKQPATARFERPQIRKDGKTIQVDMSVNYLPHLGGRIFCFARDVTERRDAEQRIVKLNEELEARVQARTEDLDAARKTAENALEAKARFLATMTHALRTPLNGLIGTVEALAQTSLESEQREMVGLLGQSATALLQTVDDILDFSKIEAGRLGIESQPMSIEDVVESAAAVLSPIADRAGAELTLFTDPNLPSSALGDDQRLKQVLFNLAANAIKFSSRQDHRSRVSLRAMVRSARPEETVVEFEIKDNGIGMARETVSQLFQSFEQVDAKISRRFGGTGLGLAIVKNLVDLMGGSIRVDSEEGTGSTFHVSIPFMLSANSISNGPSIRTELAGLSCLVVAPSGGLSGDLTAYLEAAGAAVDQVPDLAAARLRADSYRKGPVVWVFDIHGDAPSVDTLRATARERPEQDSRFVLVGRGRRRRPRPIAESVIVIDANALRRQTFLQAVTLAAGRVPEENRTSPIPVQRRIGFVPSREYAKEKGQLILVAEDNDVNQKVIRRQLGLLGYAADIASNGRLALEMWRSGDYGLLLADLHMQEMDGYELTAAIRVQENSTQHAIVIALTADVLRGGAQQCRDAGLDDYLSKPARLSDLKAMLEKWLPKTGASTSTEPPIVLAALKEIIGSEPAVIKDFLGAFGKSAAVTDAGFKTALDGKAAGTIVDLAHRLKSAARSVGASRLADLCDSIEEAGKRSDFTSLGEQIPRFHLERENVSAYIKQAGGLGA